MDFPQLINDEVLRVADFADRYDSTDAYALLNFLRVCEAPAALDIYSMHVHMYLKTKKADWINLSLEAIPT